MPLLDPTWLVDKFVECYVCWREESAAVRSGYERWNGAAAGDRALAYAAYVAALDREECAAREQRDCVVRIAGPHGGVVPPR